MSVFITVIERVRSCFMVPCEEILLRQCQKSSEESSDHWSLHCDSPEAQRMSTAQLFRRTISISNRDILFPGCLFFNIIYVSVYCSLHINPLI